MGHWDCALVQHSHRVAALFGLAGLCAWSTLVRPVPKDLFKDKPLINYSSDTNQNRKNASRLFNLRTFLWVNTICQKSGCLDRAVSLSARRSRRYASIESHAAGGWYVQYLNLSYQPTGPLRLHDLRASDEKANRWYGQHATDTLLIVRLCVFAEYTRLSDLEPSPRLPPTPNVPAIFKQVSGLLMLFLNPRPTPVLERRPVSGLQTSSGISFREISSVYLFFFPHMKNQDMIVLLNKEKHQETLGFSQFSVERLNTRLAQLS